MPIWLKRSRISGLSPWTWAKMSVATRPGSSSVTPMLPDTSARCVATARTLYSQILDRIEAADHDVFTERVRVPTRIKAATAAAALVRRPRGAGA